MSSLVDETDITTIERQLDSTIKKTSFRGTFIKGMVRGLYYVISVILISLFFNFFDYGGLFIILPTIFLILAGILFLTAGMGMWFSPSPQWAEIKSKMLEKRVKPKDTHQALKSGMEKIVSGSVLAMAAFWVG